MLGSYSSRIWHAGTHRACDRLAHRSSKPTICVLHARKHPFITCSSASSASSSGSKPVSRQRKGTAASSSAAVSGPSSMPLVTASATVAAATVTAVEQTTAAPPAESIPVVNPPLGFANNIVPARECTAACMPSCYHEARFSCLKYNSCLDRTRLNCCKTTAVKQNKL